MSTSYFPDLVPEFDDAAFEPNAGYMFDESSGMAQLQRDIEASYDSNSSLQNGHIDGSASMAWSSDQLGMSSNESQQSFQPQSLPPQGFPIDSMNENSSPTIQWQTTKALMSRGQAGVTSHREGGVAQRFGQVTPVTSQSRSPTGLSDDAQQQQQQIAQSNAKSERARNAANHRHSQTKQARDLLRKGKKRPATRDDVEVDKEDDDDKSRGPDKQEYREKNRQAAAKCRRKKKDSTEILESTARSAVEENTRLKTMVRQLRDQYSDLRTKALAHDGANGCGCSDIHQYNADQAQYAARGHAGNAPMVARDLQAMQAFQPFPNVHSPLMGNMGMPDMSGMSMGMPSSRAQSFSMGIRPEMDMQHHQHGRADSKQEELEQQAAALQMCGQNFPFDPTLDGIQEDGSHDLFQ